MTTVVIRKLQQLLRREFDPQSSKYQHYIFVHLRDPPVYYTKFNSVSLFLLNFILVNIKSQDCNDCSILIVLHLLHLYMV